MADSTIPRTSRTGKPAADRKRRSRTAPTSAVKRPVAKQAAKAPATASAKPKVKAPKKVAFKKPATSKKARLAAELLVEVKALRTALDESVEQFRIKLGGQIAQLEAVLDGTAVAGARPTKPDAKTAAAMLKQVRALKIKPKKGRTKDLTRLSDLIDDLAGMLPPQP